jgi:hypothetical protein
MMEQFRARKFQARVFKIAHLETITTSLPNQIRGKSFKSKKPMWRLLPSLIFPSLSAHLQLFAFDFSQDHLQSSRPRTNSSFGAAHPDTDRSYAEARERQPPQLIIVGVCPLSRGEVSGF